MAPSSASFTVALLWWAACEHFANRAQLHAAIGGGEERSAQLWFGRATVSERAGQRRFHLLGELPGACLQVARPGDETPEGHLTAGAGRNAAGGTGGGEQLADGVHRRQVGVTDGCDDP